MPKPFAVGILAGEGLQAWDGLELTPDQDLGLHLDLHRLQPHLMQSHPLEMRELLVTQVAEYRAPPQVEGGASIMAGPGRVGTELALGLVDKPLEAAGVYLLTFNL